MSGQVQIGYFGARLNERFHRVFIVFDNAVHRAVFRADIVPVREGRGGVVGNYFFFQSRDLLFGQVDQPFCFFLFESLVVIAPVVFLRYDVKCTFPGFYLFIFHVRHQHQGLGVVRVF